MVPADKIIHRATFYGPRSEGISVKVPASIEVEVFKRQRVGWYAREVSRGVEYPGVFAPDADAAMKLMEQRFERQTEPWTKWSAVAGEIMPIADVEKLYEEVARVQAACGKPKRKRKQATTT